MVVYLKETISKMSKSHFCVELAVSADEKINRKIIL